MKRNTGCGISLQDYRNRYTLFAFDLTPEMSEGDQFRLVRSGYLRLELYFKILYQ